MWDTLLNMATESGIWAVMFIILFYKQIKESKTREDNYQSTINTLADKLKMIADIKTDIEEIKDALSITDKTDSDTAASGSADADK
jgi:hypothetical protein